MSFAELGGAEEQEEVSAGSERWPSDGMLVVITDASAEKPLIPMLWEGVRYQQVADRK